MLLLMLSLLENQTVDSYLIKTSLKCCLIDNMIIGCNNNIISFVKLQYLYVKPIIPKNDGINVIQT